MTTPAGTIRVLHVDDAPDFTELAATFLEREDERLQVRTAPSAADGLDILATHEVDCLVSDYDMPHTNGIEFLRAVREDFPNLPFILYTGKGSEEVASDAISNGVTDYLQKQSGTDHYKLLANRIANAVEQVRAEQSLEKTRRYYQTLIEEATDAILVVDPDATISFATPSAESILGRTPEDLVGTSGFEPVHPDDQDRVVEAFAGLVDHPGESRTVEFRYEQPDGSWIWVETRGRNLTGEPLIDGIVVYARDTTERKERERELERHNERLEEFANVVGHDLQNPLSVAQARLELVREECHSDHLSDVAGALDRMNALIDDLLTLARQRDEVADLVALDLRGTVEGCWANVETADATLVTETDRTIQAAESRLKQLFENLVRNSVEHAGADATVTVGELTDGFYVEDDGPGIPAEKRDDVFEAGYSTAANGTGFGLSIVEQVAVAHGWNVCVTAGADGGARFEFTGVTVSE